MPKDKWTQPDQPPPPLFLGEKERDLVKQVNDELIERVIGQPIRVYALVEYGGVETTTEKHGLDKVYSVTVHFHKRRLTEDQDLYVREGDFVLYDDDYYEIVTLTEPREIFGQAGKSLEVSAACIKSRRGLFDAE
mgnify:CR=1 FL=1